MQSTFLTASDWQKILLDFDDVLERVKARFSWEHEIPFSAWKDEFARLRIWGEEVDIVQIRSPNQSLGERLHKIPLVREQIRRQLARIRGLVQDLWYEAYGWTSEHNESDCGSDEEEEWSEEDRAGNKNQPQCTIQEIYQHLQDSISGLNRMSSLIAQRTDIETGSVGETVAQQQTSPVSFSRPPGLGRRVFNNWMWTCVSISLALC
ncbi:hypothetical protein BJX63DRAFT_415871 [Aspergillus granulosus]|uniref:Uncharacterized protein n=1 Tax=Aspergillus granulosus TaxID=176169 RepID=A0ABR4GSR2_9EURO